MLTCNEVTFFMYWGDFLRSVNRLCRQVLGSWPWHLGVAAYFGRLQELSEKLGKSSGIESEHEKEKQCFWAYQTRKWMIKEKTSRKTYLKKRSSIRSIHFERYETFHLRHENLNQKGWWRESYSWVSEN